MIRYLPLFVAAALIVAGVALVSVPLGLIVAGAEMVVLWLALSEVPDAED